MRVGEETGALAKHLQTIVEQERRDETFRSRLQAAMLYPVVVVVIGVVVGLGVAWLVLPRLVSVFSALRVELPFLTRVLLWVGALLASDGWWLVPSIIAGVAGLGFVLFGMPTTRAAGQWLLLRTPGIGLLIRESEISRFGYVLGSLLEVGVPIDQALDALVGGGSFVAYERLYSRVHQQVQAGRTISEVLTEYRPSRRLLPGTVRQVLATAEQSARLGEASAQIGRAYEQRLEVTAKNVIAILEPALLFMVWLGVVMLAIAIVSPIYQVLQGINR